MLFTNSALAICLAVWLPACGGTDEVGTEGGACREDGSCDPGLKCNADNICEAGLFTKIFRSPAFQRCANCHAPGADGFVVGVTEATQNWSTQKTAWQTLQGKASGMTGNQADCNGVAFLGNTPETSLLAAALDEDIRAGYVNGNCTSDNISDMTLKIQGDPTSQELNLLKEWITKGAPE